MGDGEIFWLVAIGFSIVTTVSTYVLYSHAMKLIFISSTAEEYQKRCKLLQAMLAKTENDN